MINFIILDIKDLCNGETTNDIAKIKKLRYREDILDKMCSTELAANLFRITQTEEKLIRDDIKNDFFKFRKIIIHRHIQS